MRREEKEGALEPASKAGRARFLAMEPLYLSTNPIGRVLRLTLLAPDIIEAILDGRQPTAMTVVVLVRPFTGARTEQRKPIFCWKNATSVSG
jgi:hypothetical protein